MNARDERGAAEGRRPASAVARLWSRAVDGLAALGTLMIALLMVMIFCDVLARNIIGGSLPLISELGALTVVMIVFLQLGTTVRNERLARADLLLASLDERSPRAGAFVSGLWDLFGLVVCAGIAYSTWGILKKDFDHHEYIGVTGVATLETWPFRALILLGAAVGAIQFAVQAARAFSKAVGRAEPAR
jgi:TRAP-type C4-dicarboxylate transport system permease small subunit